MEKIQKKFFITLFAQQNSERNASDATFSLKHSLDQPRKINKQ